MSSGRPNPRTQELLADPEIRDRAEDAARELQDAARDRKGDRTPAKSKGSDDKSLTLRS
jgi:hypothetical protein